MGYIPGRLFKKFVSTVDASYARLPMVDATPISADVKIGSNWKTILAGGMGAGAKGVFVLDITDPTALSSASVVLEFTDLDDPDIGYVTSPPAVVRLTSRSGCRET